MGGGAGSRRAQLGSVQVVRRKVGRDVEVMWAVGVYRVVRQSVGEIGTWKRVWEWRAVEWKCLGV